MSLRKSEFGRWTPEITGEARTILRRVGLVLIAFGMLDIGVMIYCIANAINYSSSFNVFAVIAGIYVGRGHPWWVKWTTRASATHQRPSRYSRSSAGPVARRRNLGPGDACPRYLRRE